MKYSAIHLYRHSILYQHFLAYLQIPEWKYFLFISYFSIRSINRHFRISALKFLPSGCRYKWIALYHKMCTKKYLASHSTDININAIYYQNNATLASRLSHDIYQDDKYKMLYRLIITSSTSKVLNKGIILHIANIM